MDGNLRIEADGHGVVDLGAQPIEIFDIEVDRVQGEATVNLRDLLLLYAFAGVACAIAVVRRGEPAWSAALTVPLWPLWAPFALNAAAPDFWHKGLGIIGGFIDELERLG